MTVSELPSTPHRRVRLVSVTLQLALVADDGEMLTPLQSQPLQVPANEWDIFDLDAVIARAQTDLNGG